MIMKDYIISEISKTKEAVQRVFDDKDLLAEIEKIAKIGAETLKSEKKLLFAGNGGSAADSQHLAAEIVSRLCYDRPALPAIALTTDTSALTAIGNDYGYEDVFSRQLEAVGSEGDIFFAISTSGNSPNILKALLAAKDKNIITVGFTGENGGKMSGLCDYIVKVPSNETPKIQECHIMIGHIICALIEEDIYGMDYNPNRQIS
jgi:D-sedoheptulose 7-phosphate isomerase